MKYYPRIVSNRNMYMSAPWEIEPMEIISHEGITGIAERKNSLNLTGKERKGLPPTFFKHELAILAFGSDEQIASLTKEYGLLTSPFSKAIRVKQGLDKIIAQNERILNNSNHSSSDFKEALSILETSRAATSLEVAAINKSILLAQSSKAGAGDTVVSFDEIREVAKRLFNALKVTIAIGGGVSVNELLNLIDKEEIPSCPMQELNYLEHCLKDSGLLGVSLTVEDEEGNKAKIEMPEDYYPGTEDVETINAMHQWQLLYDISTMRPRKLISFTEAIALRIRNFAIGKRKWAFCDRCNKEFPLTAGKMRKTSYGTYCSKKCRSRASQQRYRDKKKKEAAAMVVSS